MCLGLMVLGGCSQTPLSPKNSETATSIQETRAIQPLNLVLQSPIPFENSTINRYLDQLSAPETAQGVWIQSETQLLANHQGTTPLPAASITKVATSLAVLKTLGPDHRFRTEISATGPINAGVLQGDLVIQGGADPLFVWEDAISIAHLLDQKGIITVAGNLVIVGPFYMNFKTDSQQSGALLKQGLNERLWPAEAATQYKTLQDIPKPQLEIQGTVQVLETAPTQINRLIDYQSLPLAELLKNMNRYSNNAMAEMLAQEVGGPQAVAKIAARVIDVPQTEIQLINGSGLGVENLISPRAACGMMLAIANLLHPQQMTIADILAVTGADKGILDARALPPQAVIKSGTLNTVSALAGALPTQEQGTIWFAILNGQGNVGLFRLQQEGLLQSLIAQWGTASQVPPLIKATQLPSRGERRQ